MHAKTYMQCIRYISTIEYCFFFFFFTDYFSDGGRRERACTRSRGKLVGGNPLNLRQKIEICFVKGLLKCLTVQIQHLRTTSGD